MPVASITTGSVITGPTGATGAIGPTGPINPSVPSIESYGHSLLASYGASDYSIGTSSKFGITERLSYMLGNAYINRVALAGGEVANTSAQGGVGMLMWGGEQPERFAGPYVSRGGIKMCYIGLNDYPLYNGVSGGAALVQNALTLAYSRLLAARIIPTVTTAGALNTAELTFSASGWTANSDATISMIAGFATSATSGATITLALDAGYNGEAITVVLPNTTTVSAVYTVSIDGTTVATQSTVPFNATLAAAGQAGSMQCVRIPAGTVTAGSHSLVVTTSSVTSLGCVTGFIIEGTDPPPLLIPLGPTYSPVSSVFATQAPWSDTQNRAAASNFPSAILVDTTPGVSPTGTTADTQYWNSALSHPNDYGYARMASVLYAGIQSYVTASKISKTQQPRIRLESWKDYVRAATTINVALAGTQTIDGVALNVGDSVLVKNQSNATYNGIYVVQANGWTLRQDFIVNGYVTPAHVVKVSEGATNRDTEWTCSNYGSIAPYAVSSIYYTRTSPTYGSLFLDPWDPSNLGDNVEREAVNSSLTLTSGKSTLFGGFVLRAGVVYSNINFFFTTAGATYSDLWGGLVAAQTIGGYSQYGVLGVSTNTTTAPTAAAIHTFAFGTTFQPSCDLPVYAVICAVATTMPAIGATVAVTNANLLGISPILSGTSTSETTPPAVGTILSAPTPMTQVGYAYLS
jgi:hypothetical protein